MRGVDGPMATGLDVGEGMGEGRLGGGRREGEGGRQ